MASLKARLVLAAVFATAVESHAGPGRFDEILKYKKAQANGDPSAVGGPRCKDLAAQPPAVLPATPQTSLALQSTCRAHSTCGECLAAPKRCVWQGVGGCDSECRLQDTYCLEAELDHHCPMDGCAAHTTCGDCTEAKCTFQSSVCKSSCEFGPLGKFIASCYTSQNGCKDLVA
mmetsp:Transcript_59478/g.153146  ORF Transcript_59478/g.153146 Transcript_59478/m.153146 type:complete len:174 (-) Transcript_59478:140-661(-)